jgi:hypothetical protein
MPSSTTEKTPRQPDNWGVYFIEAVGANAVKIGYTTSPILRRMHQLKIGSPHPLKLLACWRLPDFIEHYLHRNFKEHRLRGEWFKKEPLQKLLPEIFEEPQEPTAKEQMFEEVCLSRHSGIGASLKRFREAWERGDNGDPHA